MKRAQFLSKPEAQQTTSTQAQPTVGHRPSPQLLVQRAQANPHSLTPRDVLQLQRTYGNRFVQRLLLQNPSQPIQKGSLQAKLTVTPAGDQYEAEADAMSKQVMQTMRVQRQPEDDELQLQRQPEDDELQLQRQPEDDELQLQRVDDDEMQLQRQPEDDELQLQRQPEDDELQLQRSPDFTQGGEVGGSIESQIRNARGGGQPLPENVRTPMENAFGTDFSSVRVHTDSSADTLNRSVQAKAFTTGSDLFFSSGTYQPQSQSGQELLAHELTHVVQQGSAVQRVAEPSEQKKTNAKRFRIKSTSPTRSMLHRKIKGYATLQDVGNAIQNNMSAYFLLTSSNEAQEFIDERAKDALNNYVFYNSNKPKELRTAKNNKDSEIKSNDDLAKWVVALYFELTKTYSDTGYDPQHGSQITKTEEHEVPSKGIKAKWEVYIEELTKVPMTFGQGLGTNPYDALVKSAKDAAVELDQREVGGTIKPDLSAEFAAVNNLIAHINTHKDAGTTKLKPRIPTWKTESKYGTGLSVHAEFEPYTVAPRGSGITIQTPIDWFYEGKQENGEAQYKKGHLLNDHVGGQAKNYNLSPIYSPLNDVHAKSIENELKAAVLLLQLGTSGKHKPLYHRVVYDVELGPHQEREETKNLEVASTFLTNYPNQDATIDDVLKDVSTPKELKNLVAQNNINTAVVIKNVIALLKFDTLLWRAEDYLVRDWYVRLQVDRVDGSTDINRVTIPNRKYKSRNLAAIVKVPQSNTAAGFKYHPTTSLPPSPLSDTSEHSATRSIGIENRLSNMSKVEYETFGWWARLRGTKFIFWSHKSFNFSTDLPEYNVRNESLASFVHANKAILFDLLNKFNYEEVSKIRNQDTVNQINPFQQASFAFGTLPEEQGRKIMESQFPTQKFSDKGSIEKFIKSSSTTPLSPERRTNAEAFEQMLPHLEQARAYEQERKKGKEDGKKAGFRAGKGDGRYDDKIGGSAAYIEGYAAGYEQGYALGDQAYRGARAGKRAGYDHGYRLNQYNPRIEGSLTYQRAFEEAYKSSYEDGVYELGYKHGKVDGEKNNYRPDSNNATYLIAYKKAFNNYVPPNPAQKRSFSDM